MKSIDAPFYLTGGTALSRVYGSPRYSDDLDLFVNDNSEFSRWIDRLYAELEKTARKGSFKILSERTQKFENYVQLFVVRHGAEGETINLKIDFVNDVAPRYGELEKNAVLGRIDSWRNILSNKITALFRIEVKDVVDLWHLARSKSFNWAETVREASSKEAGIDTLALYDLLKSFPGDELSSIKWIKPEPDYQGIMDDLIVIAEDIFEGRQNSLVPDPAQ